MAESVDGPGADGGARGLEVAGLHHEQGGLVIGDVCVHRADDAAVVDDAAHVGEAFTDIDATLAYLFESERRGHEAAAGTLLEQLAIGMLASMTGEGGLGIEGVDV